HDLVPFIRLFLTGREPAASEWEASKSFRRRSSDLGDEPALDIRSSPWRGRGGFSLEFNTTSLILILDRKRSLGRGSQFVSTHYRRMRNSPGTRGLRLRSV